MLPDFPQCRLRLARFRGLEKTDFLDNRQFHGNAFELLARAENFLIDHLPVAGKIVSGLLARVDEPSYPPLALREALANAICHRDYSIGGGSVGIAIFDDRLEITSSGDLHFGLRVEDLYRAHESLPWNPLIAHVFYRRGIIEAWGRGTLKMVELMQHAGKPRPDIEAVRGAVTVRFLRGGARQTDPELSDRQRTILDILCQGNKSLAEIHAAALKRDSASDSR